MHRREGEGAEDDVMPECTEPGCTAGEDTRCRRRVGEAGRRGRREPLAHLGHHARDLRRHRLHRAALEVGVLSEEPRCDDRGRPVRFVEPVGGHAAQRRDGEREGLVERGH